MDNRDKKTQWVRSLSDAGLIDPIEEAWEMPKDPENEPISVNPKQIAPSSSSKAEDPTSMDDGVPVPQNQDLLENEEQTKRVKVPSAAQLFAAASETEEDNLEFDDFARLGSDSDKPASEPHCSKVPFAIPIPSVPPVSQMEINREGQVNLKKKGASLPHAFQEATISSTPLVSNLRATSKLFHEAISQLEEAKRARLRADIALETTGHDQENSGEGKEDHLAINDGVLSHLQQPPPQEFDQNAVTSRAPERSTPKLEYHPVDDDSMPPLRNPYRRPLSSSPEITPTESKFSPKEEMQKKYELGDYIGALELAESILANSPMDELASQICEVSRDVLLQMYESQIGPMDRYPKPVILPEEVIWRNLDPSSSFVLSQIDGTLSFDDILDVSGMNRLETCRILSKLLQEGIIE